MKMFEVLADKIINIPLLEMAVERKIARQNIHHISFTTIYHIVKIIIIPDAQHKDHWIREVNEHLRDIQNIILKPKNKRLNANLYRLWLVEEPEPRINRMAEQVKYDYPNDKFEVPYDLDVNVRNILNNVCKDLGNDSFIGIQKYL